MSDVVICRRKRVKPPAESIHDVPLISRLLADRKLESRDDLEFSLANLPRPHSLLGIDAAVTRIAHSLEAQEKILIVGDYDCDGATSTTLAILALRSMGANHVNFKVPNRFEFGYGLSPAFVDSLSGDEPDLIITVDNGIASIVGVERAGELGIDVVVTDHHLPPPVLPQAVAIVNPNIPGATFPSNNLAGVGVIYYVMIALRARLRSLGWFEANRLIEPRLDALLDLVAVGTVADVVALDSVNRTLVEQGLRRIRAGRTRLGIKALCHIAGKDLVSLASTDIGYILGPRINAAGRLDDISIGIQCLLSELKPEANSLAEQLDTLNRERRNIEAAIKAEADLHVANSIESLGNLESSTVALCLYEPHWHEGVIGIVAGRLKENLNVPTIVFGGAGNGLIKGSGRSIPALHLRDALQEVANRLPGMIDKFGGHAMAAGLTLKEGDFAEFKIKFEDLVREKFGTRRPGKVLETDGALEPSEFSVDIASQIRFVVPWGQGFPEPLFDGDFDLVSSRILKEKHLKMLVSPKGSSERIDAIAFNHTLQLSPGDSVKLVYRLDVNEYRNRHNLQLVVVHAEIIRSRERQTRAR